MNTVKFSLKVVPINNTGNTVYTEQHMIVEDWYVDGDIVSNKQSWDKIYPRSRTPVNITKFEYRTISDTLMYVFDRAISAEFFILAEKTIRFDQDFFKFCINFENHGHAESLVEKLADEIKMPYRELLKLGLLQVYNILKVNPKLYEDLSDKVLSQPLVEVNTGFTSTKELWEYMLSGGIVKHIREDIKVKIFAGNPYDTVNHIPALGYMFTPKYWIRDNGG